MSEQQRNRDFTGTFREKFDEFRRIVVPKNRTLESL